MFPRLLCLLLALPAITPAPAAPTADAPGALVPVNACGLAAPIDRLFIEPSAIDLKGPGSTHNLLITAITNGRAIDVTRFAKFTA